MSSAAVRCSCFPLGLPRTRPRAGGAGAAERPPQDQALEATPPLVQFILSTAKVDEKIVAYMTETLQLKTISDFSNLWTATEYEKGIQNDIVQKVPGFEDASQPLSRLQIARLRTAWIMAQGSSAAPVVKEAPKAAGTPVVGMGWTCPQVTGLTFDTLWEALVCKARNPLKFNMDVSDVVVADRPGYLARSMTVNSTGKRVEEHIYANERNGEMIYRLVDERTKLETDDERVIAVKEDPLRMEFFHRHVSDGYRVYWEAPLDPVKQMVQELVDYSAKVEGKSQVVGLGTQSEAIEGVSHDALWRSMMASVRDPARFFDCSEVSVEECKGCVRRELLIAHGEASLEHIYVDEPSCEVVYRRLVNGAETDVERVVALRTHPLRLEFHQRNRADGFRVHWGMPRSAVLGCVEAIVREARRLDGARPATVGYGLTSDPVRGPSYDSIFAAVALSVKEPWRVMDVDQGSCDVRDCEGYVQRRMRLNATGECVVERVTVNEEAREVAYNKCDSSGRPGDVERVLAVHTPLRLEFYERSVCSGLRVDWKAPCDVARDTFSKIVQLAGKIETATTDNVGLGLASKPITGSSQDALWRAMLSAMRNPAVCGLKVNNVRVRDMDGYMQRSMCLLEKSGKPTVTDNIRVVESAQEITYRPVVNDQECEKERVFALRTDPLRFEMFCRHSEDGVRLDWQAPRTVALGIFDSTLAMAQHM